MRAGKLDRRITIQCRTSTQSDSGDPVITWVEVATVWAEHVNIRGSERLAQQQVVGYALMTFRIRWSSVVSEVSVLHRIIFDARTYDITDVRETKRREEIELDCFAPSEDAVTP